MDHRYLALALDKFLNASDAFGARHLLAGIDKEDLEIILAILQ